MLRPCLTCGALTDGASYCRAHGANASSTRQTPGRTRPAEFRAAVLRNAGYQCQAVVAGERCPVTGAALLQAHHVDSLRRGGANDPSNGVALCRRHHELTEGERSRCLSPSTNA